MSNWPTSPPPSIPPDELVDDTSMRMQPLLERGIAAFDEHLSRIPVQLRPFGHGQMHIVTREDFEEHVRLCIDHVELSGNGKPLHVLCPSGRLCILVEKWNR